MSVQQRLQQDLEYLRSSFPYLKEEFPTGEWKARHTGFWFVISFEIEIWRRGASDALFKDLVPLIAIDFDETRNGSKYVISPWHLMCLDIRDVEDVLTKMSRALVPR